MRLVALAGLLSVLAATASDAQQISVRSGEHDGFSRLVFMFPRGTAWAVEQVAGGYRLSTTSTDFQFNLAEVFKFIPKTRISAIHPDVDRRSIFVNTSDAVHSESFQLENGAVVLDVIDGADAEISTPPPPIQAPSFRPKNKDGYLQVYWGAQEPVTPGDAANAQVHDAVNPLTISPPDSRVKEAEAALIDQLGRAATQGLLTLELPSHTGIKAPEATADPPHETGISPNKAGIALSSETVIDRDMEARRIGSWLTESAHTCPPDGAYDLRAWLTDEDPGTQIGNARRSLLEEFDKVLPENVVKLSRTYLALGFGLEARALMDAFSMPEEDRKPLDMIADIIDGRAPPATEDWKSMMACDSKVALWAFLAQTENPSKAEVNLGAVLIAFSALPAPVREILGPELSKRFLEFGAPDLARTVRASLARAPMKNEGALNLVDAQIEIDAGAVDDAQKRLAPVADENTETGAEALALELETRLAQGEAIGEEDTQSAIALGLQLASTDLGARLKRVGILGQASTGHFKPAFAELGKWRNSTRTQGVQQTDNDLAALLAKVPDDQIFLTTYFEHVSGRNPQDFSPKTQLDLADRLVALGFANAATDALSDTVRNTEQGRLTLAGAAILSGDGAAAVAHLATLEGEDASGLRGDALRLLERHQLAAIEYERAGKTGAQVNEAWRSGDWSLVSKQGTEAQQRFLTLFSTASQTEPAPRPDDGPIAQAEQLIKRSAAEREAYEVLMSGLK